MALSTLLIIGSIDQVIHNNILINGIWLWVILLPFSIFLFKLEKVINKIDNNETSYKNNVKAVNNLLPAGTYSRSKKRSARKDTWEPLWARALKKNKTIKHKLIHKKVRHLTGTLPFANLISKTPYSLMMKQINSGEKK
jgi:phosphorylcholine metabolism protein LicD